MKKAALVLSAGGARGMAHVGVIEGLQEKGYEITSIAGSSIGALIGAFYACGKLDVYKEWVCKLDKLDVFKLIDFTFSVQGFIRGEKVFKTLEGIIPDCNIEDLDIPFVAIATDVKSKEEVVLDHGSMYKAIKASVAIPTVIKPVSFDGKELIDGGVTNPIPVDRIPRTQGDILVVSNVSAAVPYQNPEKNLQKIKTEEASYQEKLNSFLSNWSKLLPGSSAPKEKLGYFDLLTRSIDLMQDKMTSLLMEYYRPDIRVDVSRDACSTFEFYRAAEMIKAGRQHFEASFQTFEENQPKAKAS
jgi:NTE family protein